MKSNQRFKHREAKAFTLIEMIVVMTIIGLLTGMAVMKFREPYLAANFETTIRRIAALDDLSRNHAARGEAGTQLTIDLENGFVRGTGGSVLQLNSKFEIERVLLANGTKTNGEVVIPISSNGQSPTYGLHMTGAGDREVWLVFLGLAGQLVRLDGAGESDEIHKTYWPTRPDAA